MKKAIFTICSNNYLAQAKVLGDSVLRYAPEYTFTIFLCDKKQDSVDYTPYDDFLIVEVANVPIPKFDSMAQLYNIIELNTSVKPFCFEYLYDKYDADLVIYLDPDTCIFSPLDYIEKQLKYCDIILTPHILTPIEPDELLPQEKLFTNYGIYNLGFLATKKSPVTQSLLQWWQRRLEVNCYNKTYEGTFVDQLPMSFAPLFFENVLVSKNKGLNMAPWNLHERHLLNEQGKWLINNNIPLIFYHFSNYRPSKPSIIADHYTRVTFKDNPILKSLYDWYREELLKNNYENLSKIDCGYSKVIPEEKAPVKKSRWKALKKHLLFFLRKD